jgi:asparagine synthase (glutamine-hydrolysing)
MPGLLGYWTQSKDIYPQQLLADMASSMQHQDHLKIETSIEPGFTAGRVHLGYFQPKPQPMKDVTQRYDLWLDGEFNNALDLVKLYDIDSIFAHEQAALALLLYQKVGWVFLPDVDGLFNIALYDKQTHQLTLVNDRFGLRPLCWVQTSQGVAYAGEVKALLQIPDVQRKIDGLAVDEWFSFGYLLDNRTWVEGIELYPPATIMQISAAGIQAERYWSWDDIQPLSKPVNETGVVEELGRLWVQAIERRVDECRVGQLLSGGLDSRAILAALPATKHPYHALTFGRKDSDDNRIARQVAALKGVEHHFVEITEHNWLLTRLNGLWRIDGMGKILDLHGAEAIATFGQYCHVQLQGFLGDAVAGGSYLGATEASTYLYDKIALKSESGLELPDSIDYLLRKYLQTNLLLDRFLVNQRGRRFIATGPILASAFLEVRKPFFDKDFLTFLFSLPDDLRANSYIYNKMLLRYFPKFYDNIPWEKTGLPISASKLRQQVHHTLGFAERAIRFTFRKVGVNLPVGRKSYTNYPLWLRVEPTRSFITKLLTNSDALYVNYIDSRIARSLVTDFLEKGNNKNLTTIGLLLTFEIYLRQLFEPQSFQKLSASLYASG